MSIKSSLRNQARGLVRRVPVEVRSGCKWLTVLHVEALDNDRNLTNVLNYARGFRALTGKRMMATVMTPRSPLLRRRLERDGLSETRYLDALFQVAEHADIGLHGHYMYGEDSPQQATFFDLASCVRQLQEETEYLAENELFREAPRTYSGGWWFMVPVLQAAVAEAGFLYDFSLSASPENFGLSAHQARKEFAVGDRISITHGSRTIFGAFAVTSCNQPDGAYVALVKHGALSWRIPQSRYLTFYGHDYDLQPEKALRSIEALLEDGMGFFAPGELGNEQNV